MRKAIGYFILIIITGGILTLDTLAIIEDPKGVAIFFFTCVCLVSIVMWAVKLIKF